MAENCEDKFGQVERIRNQDGVAFFSNLKNAPKIILVGLDISYIGYLLQTKTVEEPYKMKPATEKMRLEFSRIHTTAVVKSRPK
ncbi:Hypothetical predicted protein [Paramuricea clavata]|uniref:Uncharacterized protein n=1 Tax=Paramuricea clavata TaxID=317549 RepID=A0A6S7GJB0_PARCT|nr:Hypothetical predicted protein [Paramuricea clavata]